jgi:IS605 OrfB family transposase
MTITRKIQVLFDTNDKEELNKNWQSLRDLSYMTYKAFNIATQQLYLADCQITATIQANKDLKQLWDAGQKSVATKLATNMVKELYGCSIENTGYRSIGSAMPSLGSDIKAVVSNVAAKNYSADKKTLLSGDSTLRTYRRGCPIPFRKTKMKFATVDGEIFFDWLADIRFKLHFGRDKSNNRAIVDRIMSGEYKACNSSIVIDENKVFLLLCVDVPNEKPSLDPDKVVGVDLGIAVPAYVALLGSKACRGIGNAAGLLKPRLRIQAQRRALQKSLAFVNGGKGRKKKLARLEKLKKAERNTVQTINHNISKQVIDFAIKSRAGIIAIEDLSGFGKTEEGKQEESKQFVLRNWSFFELQQFIQYKAKRVGIKVVKVKAAYTSQTCHTCGEIGERPIQAEFYCKNEQCKDFDKKVFADYNAALNIAKRANDPKYVVEEKKKRKKKVAKAA